MTDIKSRLQRGDAHVRAGRHAEAVAEYVAAADSYMQAGIVLKAAAILRQVVEIVDRSAPELAAVRSGALRRLVECYATLGLTDEAEAVRCRLASTPS